MAQGASRQLWEERVGRAPNLGTGWKWEDCLVFSLPPASGVVLGTSLPLWMPGSLTGKWGEPLTEAAVTPCGRANTQSQWLLLPCAC